MATTVTLATDSARTAAIANSNSKSVRCCLIPVSLSTTKLKRPIIVLETGKVTVGRSNEVDVCLQSNVISRLHATFVQSCEGSWAVVDNGSLNGIFVNKTRPEINKEITLNDGDMVQFGVPVQRNLEPEFVYKFCRRRNIRVRRKQENRFKDKVSSTTTHLKSDECDDATDDKDEVCINVSDSDECKDDRKNIEQNDLLQSSDSKLVKVENDKNDKGNVIVDEDLASTCSTALVGAVEGENVASTSRGDDASLQNMKMMLKDYEDRERFLTEVLERERTRTEQSEYELWQMKMEKDNLMAEVKKKTELEKEIESEKRKSLELAEKEKKSMQMLNVMESEFTCSICSELFIRATTLNCSHSFCEDCIKQWCKKKNLCPICRTSITSKVYALALDNFIKEIVESSDELKDSRNKAVKEREAKLAAAAIAGRKILVAKKKKVPTATLR